MIEVNELPRCLICGGMEFRTGPVIYSCGTTQYFRCFKCDVNVLSRDWGPPHILVWVIESKVEELWPAVNRFFNEMRTIYQVNMEEMRKAITPDQKLLLRETQSDRSLPPIPAGLLVQVRRRGIWVKL